VLAVGFPSATGGENSQRCAAFKARPAKYLLGPGEVSFAVVTLPDGSTSTLTPTFTVPEIVFCALLETSGSTWCKTSPPDADNFFGVATG
jgi:hypothetical protein